MQSLGQDRAKPIGDDRFAVAAANLWSALADDKADIAVGTSWSGGALAMAPVAEEYKKIAQLLVRKLESY
ncbi:MAG: hypothetical protein MUD03_06645 [Pirellula sp.]|nr:hypothetical protein [Pirellula sp.]